MATSGTTTFNLNIDDIYQDFLDNSWDNNPGVLIIS